MAQDNELKNAVLKALSGVEEPELHKDLVTLNMIQDLSVDQGTAKFKINLTTPACPLKGKIDAEARKAVLAVPGIRSAEITFGATVPQDARIRGKIDLPVKNAIAVGSGKGGVGKSTVAVNLAIALAKLGAKVGLLDADIYGPNIPTMMGVDHLPMTHNNRIQPAEAYGVKVMSIGFMVKPGQAMIWRGPMLHTAIRQFLNDVEWGELDYLVIDLPPGTGDAQISLAQTIPLSGGIIVTLPQQVSVEDAQRAVEMYRALQVPVLGIIENMSYLDLPDGTRMEIFGAGGGERLATAAGVPLLGKIPMEQGVREGGDAGKPIVVTHPDSEAARILREISQLVAAQISMSTLAAIELKVEE